MATMLPDLSDAQLEGLPPRREAEVLVYRACRDQLPADVVVPYSVATLVRNGVLHEGEADFVVLDPRRGLLVIEVKGGGIRYGARSGTWASKDRDGVVHDIKDPFLQASSRMHDLQHLLRNHPDWTRAVKGRTTFAHAAFFPHLNRAEVSALRLPHTPMEIVGAREDLGAIGRWIEGVYRFSGHPSDQPIGAVGVQAGVSVLRKDVVVDVPRAMRMAAQDQERIRLTEQQAAILEIIADRDRIAVSGGAGTGKTMLALIEVRRHVSAGGQPLLLCFNQLLGRYLANVSAGGEVAVMTVHQLYEWWSSTVSKQLGRNLIAEAEAQYPGQSREQVVLPQAFCVALDEGLTPPFDSIIVDEGQDLCDADWLAMDALLEKTHARLVIFHDHNQALYRPASCFPITDERDQFALRRNCRNTTPIHDSTYRFYQGPPTVPSPIHGDTPAPVHAANRGAQARQVRDLVQRALADGVPAEEIAVLILARDVGKTAYFNTIPALDPACGVSWGLSQYRVKGRVIVESAGRFKGLEAGVVVLWIGDDLDATVHREWLYVGMSRAKSSLYLVGTKEACVEALDGVVGIGA